jgi:DNA-binding NarL/FixJ family response regulator
MHSSDQIAGRAPVSILIADDSPSIRRSLRSLVTQESDWQVCGEAENGARAVEMVQGFRPSVVVLDLSMPLMNGLEAARQIRAIAPEVHILLFTFHESPQLLEHARKVGVNDVVSKSGDVSKLLDVIRARLAGRRT